MLQRIRTPSLITTTDTSKLAKRGISVKIFQNKNILNDRRFSVNPLSLSVNTAQSTFQNQRRLSRKDIPTDSRASHEFDSATDSEPEEEKRGRSVDPSQTPRSSRASSQQNDYLFLLSSKSHQQYQSGTQPFRRTSANQPMRKVMRCLVLGAQRCGKSAILQELACVEDVLQRPYVPTIEDTYQIQTGVDSSDKPREIVIFHDTAGYSRGPIEIRRSYLAVADAFLLVYSVLNMDTFERIDALKKYIDKNLPKDKRELPIVVVGTMIDLPGRQVDIEMASTWASKERVKFFEVSSQDRGSLVEVVHYLVGRHFHPIKEAKFSLSKKLKPERQNAQILMDF